VSNWFCQPSFLRKVLGSGIAVSPFPGFSQNANPENSKVFLYYESHMAHKELRVQLLVERNNFKVFPSKTPGSVNNKNKAHNVIKTIIISQYASLLTAKDCCLICFTSQTIYQQYTL
jgi:hypothetical protein